MSGIVVGYDESQGSRDALEWAVKQARLTHADLRVVAVLEWPLAGTLWAAAPYTMVPATGVEDYTSAVRESVGKMLADIGVGDLKTTVHVETGEPAHVLIERSRDADMVVVGSRGAGGFARLLMGSVSTAVVHHATCPVVVIPGPHREK